MDFISHGLWGSITFGRKSRWSFGLAFAIGMAPDLFSFGVLYIAAAFGFSPKPDFSHGTPPESTIPQYVHHLYNYTHSFVVFLVVFRFMDTALALLSRILCPMLRWLGRAGRHAAARVDDIARRMEMEIQALDARQKYLFLPASSVAVSFCFTFSL